MALGAPTERVEPQAGRVAKREEELGMRTAKRSPPPDSSSSSAANSRIVSSIPRRPLAQRRTRLWSSSDSSVPRSAAQTSSAASRVKLPAKTARRAEQLLLGGVEQVVAPLDRRPQRALALGSVPAPAGEKRQRVLEPLEQLLRARAGACGPRRARPRAEARPGGGRSRARPRAAPRRAARARKSATASSSGSGSTGYSCSPAMRSSAREVTSRRRFGQRSSSSASAGAASITCSRLSSRSRSLVLADVLGDAVLRPDRLAHRGQHELAGRRQPQAGRRRRRRRSRSTSFGRNLQGEPRFAASRRAR